MVETLDNLKVVSEITVSTGALVINCVFDDSNTPTFYKSRVLSEDKIIDNIQGKIGELLITHTDDGEPMLNEKGELILSSDVDNLMRYAQVEENKQTQTIYLEYSEYLLTAAGDRILTEDGDALLWRGDIEE
jgi:hypothetical protein